MKILVIDNSVEKEFWGARPYRDRLIEAGASQVSTRRSEASDFPNLSQFDGLVLTGSRTSAVGVEPWIEPLLAYIREAIDQKLAVFGICFGHQMLARAYGGLQCVRTARLHEIGWTSLRGDPNFALFQGLPPQFMSFSYHYDEVYRLPSHFKAYASSENCEVQAYQVGDQPVFGVQFHPEKPVADARVMLRTHRLKDESDLHFNPKVGQIIFKNFLAQARLNEKTSQP